jgi:hypothetical protein
VTANSATGAKPIQKTAQAFGYISSSPLSIQRWPIEESELVFLVKLIFEFPGVRFVRRAKPFDVKPRERKPASILIVAKVPPGLVRRFPSARGRLKVLHPRPNVTGFADVHNSLVINAATTVDRFAPTVRE